MAQGSDHFSLLPFGLILIGQIAGGLGLVCGSPAIHRTDLLAFGLPSFLNDLPCYEVNASLFRNSPIEA
jgi:hypothetical protein